MAEHLDAPQCYWNNILWTDETKDELENTTICKWRHSTPTTKPHLNFEVWWGEHQVLRLSQGLDWLLSLMEKWIHKINKTLSRRIQGHLFTNLQDNNPKLWNNWRTERLKQREILFLEWTGQSPDLKQTEMLWHDLKREIHTRHQRILLNWNSFVKRNGPDSTWGSDLTTGNVWFRLLLPEED